MAASNAHAPQQPTGSGFGHQSTAAEVLEGRDLSGRHAIVTGGYSGIGLEMVRALRAAGAAVTVPARRPDAAREALQEMNADGSGRPDATVAAMDLADAASVRRFARDWQQSGRALDIQIQNAGVMATPEQRGAQGWEHQLAVNHIGHAALFEGLAPAMEQAADAKGDARLVTLSSTAHHLSDTRWDDPHFERGPYDKWQAYGQSKTAVAQYARAVDAHYAERGVRAWSAHPGGIFTPLQRHLPDEEMVALGWKNPDGTVPEGIRDAFKNTEQGAATAVWAATSPQLRGTGGAYCEDCDIAAPIENEDARYKGARPYLSDDAKAHRLWEMTRAWMADF